MNILIVEDDPSHTKLMSIVLKEAGNAVSCVETAEQTLSAIRRGRPEIILLDLALPGMDGLALARKIKADPGAREIPIVAVTAFPDLWNRHEAMEAGCSGYMLKPLDTRRFAQQLAAIAREAADEVN